MADKSRQDVYSIQITEEEAARDIRPGSPLMAKWAKARARKLKHKLQGLDTEEVILTVFKILGVRPEQRQTAVMQLPEDKPISYLFPKEAMAIRKRLAVKYNIRTVNEMLRYTRSELEGWFCGLKTGKVFFGVIELHGLQLNTLDALLADPIMPEVINFVDALPDIYKLEHYDSAVNQVRKNLEHLHPYAYRLVWYCREHAGRFKGGFGHHLAWVKKIRAEIAQLEACAAQS
jgi:hypothetical protein